MALRATIHKADLHVADSDRHYYGSHSLTIAKHPSETEQRMMIRIIAFALQAHEDLIFTKGLSDTDEPDLWIKDLTDAIKLWIEIGQPDERRILKACGRADQVVVGEGQGLRTRCRLRFLVRHQRASSIDKELLRHRADSSKEIVAEANGNHF
jgi:uncharacterized protein YaeQ